MSAGAIGGAAAATAADNNGFASLSSDEFMKILLSELSNQDPFEPQDSAALLEQLNSIRSIESQISLQDQLENLVLQNQIASAGGLIGKSISGLDANNDAIDGIVTAVRVEDDEVFLELDTGKQLATSRVTRIFE